jgi:hypothetical protein
VVLLSDCVHNAGPDPRPEAARLQRLDVLLDVSGEQDVDLARELTRAGHGRLARIRTYRDVAPSLGRAFAQSSAPAPTGSCCTTSLMASQNVSSFGGMVFIGLPGGILGPAGACRVEGASPASCF